MAFSTFTDKSPPWSLTALDGNFSALGTGSATTGASLVGFLASGTGAVARTAQAKERDIVSVLDFGPDPTGVVDSTTAIQAAINATPAGGILFFPTGIYKFSNLTTPNAIYLIGQGWHSRGYTVFGGADWPSAVLNTGTILRSTATSGIAIALDNANQLAYHLRDIALIGPGSGTSIGIKMGGTQPAVMADWHNVFIANFATGLNLNNSEDGDFVGLRIRGCTTGLSFTTQSNQNCFYNFEGQFNGTAVLVASGSLIIFYGGLLQNNTIGYLVQPNAAGGIDTPQVFGTWFEGNTTDISVDTTTGPITALGLVGTRSTKGPVFAGANSLNVPTFLHNQWAGATVTLPSNASDTVWLGNNVTSLTDNSTALLNPNSWVTFNPVITNVTTSAINGRYRTSGRQITFKFQVTVSAAPTGVIKISLPKTASAALPNLTVGYASGVVAGTYPPMGAVWLFDANTLAIHASGSGSEWDATHPGAWVNGNTFEATVIYQT